MITLIFTLEGCRASSYLSDASRETGLFCSAGSTLGSLPKRYRMPGDGRIFLWFAPKAQYLFSANRARLRVWGNAQEY
jgi:hypothetical protein